MDVRSKFLLPSLCFLTLILAGCGGSSNSGSTITPPPPPTTYQLTVTAPAANTGMITSNPGNISCPTTCTASFNQNTQVTLTASPAANYTFGGWGSACSGTSLTCQITMTAATSVTATFTASVVPTYAVTVTTAGTGTGTVAGSAIGIACASGSTTGCTANVAQNTPVTLTETPGTTSAFSGWTGAGCSGTGTTCTFTVTAATAITATFASSTSTPYAALNHIILFAQENRSFDHYFGYMRQYWANNGIPDQSFDGLPQFNPVQAANVQPPYYGLPPTVPGCQLSTDADSCTVDPTNQIASFSFHTLQLNSGNIGTVCEENQSPFWNEAHNDWDYTDPTGVNPAALNGFVYTAAYDARSNGFMDVNGVRGMGYLQDPDLNFYYALATDFATSDYWFSPVMDRTQINRAYIYAATSQGFAYPPGGGYNDSHSFTAKTIFEALQDASVPITWKIYVDPTNAYYNGEDCSTASAGQAQDMCLAEISYMNEFAYETQIQNPAMNLWQHFAPISQFAIDMQDDATFPQFALIEPASSAGLDEHPSDADGSPVNVQLGAQYVQNTIIEPFLQSNIYQDSALIFTYDEAGGLYDHVAPQPATPPGDDLTPIDLEPGDICSTGTAGQAAPDIGTCTFGWTGYRVPLVVISPYAKQNFVSHNVRDTTAVLAMVEDRFGIPPLTNRDASYNSAQTAHVTMAEFFDFVNKPWATPPTFAKQNVSGNCDQTPPTAWNEPPEIEVEVTGGGSITSSPSSEINLCTTDCTGVFSTGTVVTLTETPNTGSTFTGWGNACTGTATTCTVTPTALSTVTATFNP